jgi:hypothetical protein
LYQTAVLAGLEGAKMRNIGGVEASLGTTFAGTQAQIRDRIYLQIALCQGLFFKQLNKIQLDFSGRLLYYIHRAPQVAKERGAFEMIRSLTKHGTM